MENQKQITENNKLIAEFLNELTTDPNGNIKEDLNFLDFHYNWNSLQRLISKIEENHFVIIVRNYCTIELKNLTILLTNEAPTKKEAVYNACVEFIKWYNEQK